MPIAWLVIWDAMQPSVIFGVHMCRFLGIVCPRQPDMDNRISIFMSLLVSILFIKFRSIPHRVLTPVGSDPEPEPNRREAHFNQIARVDEGLWAWHFVLRDAQGRGIASVSRAFRGFGREV